MVKSKLTVLGSLTLALFFGGCAKDNQNGPPLPEEGGTEQIYEETLNLTIDKAKYDPGEKVHFTVDETPSNTRILYKFLGKVIAEKPLNSTTWTWTPPVEDFKGYMVELVKTSNAGETILGTVGVDVSSNWTRFPRYGFLSKFGDISKARINGVLNNLKNFHINGLQFYDWHYKHHIPLRLNEDGTVAQSWTDVFNREIYLSTVKEYIAGAKERNMASMFYNLLFGVLNPEENDGISNTWFLYNDRHHKNINKHSLGDFGDILLTDPSNPEWQEYIFGKTEIVYENLNFDGWHLDQLGNRGVVYDYTGYKVPLAKTYQDFLVHLEERFPNKKMVLNAVDQFGQNYILNTPVDFAYTEVWSPERYRGLADIILENNTYSDGELSTVLAAYVNYESTEGTFNTPSVLLADAVIFAFGGAHLELGEHMLSNEYFPNDKLSMDSKLKASLKEYYDFLVAYENLLRDGGNFNDITVSSIDGGVTFNNWPPIYSQVSVVNKKFTDKQVLHLLNFDGVSTLKWRDNDKVQTTPNVKNDFEVHIEVGQPVTNVWFASPDFNGGASRELAFKQNGNQISVQLPYLEYWSMLVIEY